MVHDSVELVLAVHGAVYGSVDGYGQIYDCRISKMTSPRPPKDARSCRNFYSRRNPSVESLSRHREVDDSFIEGQHIPSTSSDQLECNSALSPQLHTA